MAKDNDKGMVFFYNWLDMMEELKPQEVVQMLHAIVDYSRGTCDTEFEDRCMRVVYKSITTSIDLSKGVSEARSEAGKRGGEANVSKVKQTEANVSKPKQNEANVSKVKQTEANESKWKQTEANVSEKKRKENKRKEEKRKEDVEAEASTEQQPLPELTEFTAGIIKDCWNAQSVTRDVDRIPIFGTRSNNTRLCIDQDFGSFIALIKDLDNQYFFQEMAKQGKPIDYDWFVNPDHHLAIREGKYKEKHKNMQHIEGAWTDDGLEFGW